MSGNEKSGFFRRHKKLLAFTALGLTVFLLSPTSDGTKKWVSQRVKVLVAPPPPKSQPKEDSSKPIPVDVSTNFFARFHADLLAETPIRISIRSTEYDLSVRWNGRTTAEFVIKARSESDYRKYSETIESMVFDRGLRCFSDANKEKETESPLFNARKSTIEPGTDFQGWVVRLEEVHPSGVIELTFQDAHADLSVEMPDRIPLWSVHYGFSLDRKNKTITIRNKEKDKSAKAGEGAVLLKPGLKKDGTEVAGYRVLRVFSTPGWTCAWLEVMYDDSPTRIERKTTEWPGVDIVTRNLEGPGGFRTTAHGVRFKDEEESFGENENNIGQFESGGMEILQVDKIFNGKAVSFKLYDRNNDWIADLLVLCESH